MGRKSSESHPSGELLVFFWYCHQYWTLTKTFLGRPAVVPVMEIYGCGSAGPIPSRALAGRRWGRCWGGPAQRPLLGPPSL